MIIVLGGAALSRALAGRPDTHVHPHAHGSVLHVHLHFHGPSDAHPIGAPGAHEVHRLGRMGIKPLLVGLMHGLAGSATLTLLVLAHIQSTALGLLYLFVFGLGSIGGMAMISVAIGLPFAVTAVSPSLNRGIRVATGALSLFFGVAYAWSQLA